MARKRKAVARSAQHEFRLEGGSDTDKVRITRMFPTDDGGVAIAWASGVLMYDEVDGTGKYARGGQVVPPGEYTLSLVGPLATEPLFRILKNTPNGTWLVSWEGL